MINEMFWPHRILYQSEDYTCKHTENGATVSEQCVDMDSISD